METTTKLTPAVRKAFREIAAGIRTHGHYQGRFGQTLMRFWGDEAAGSCCVICNPGFPRDPAMQDAIIASLKVRIGKGGVVDWSNETSTDEVLAVLDELGTEPEEFADEFGPYLAKAMDDPEFRTAFNAAD